MITIYNFPRGARGIRVFWVCEEMGLPYRAEAVSYPPSDAYKALHPMGSVPFLVDGEAKISESVAMMIYVAERYGPTPLLPPKEDPRHARVLEMATFGESSLGAPMNPLIMTRFGAPDAEKANWSARAIENQIIARSLRFVVHRLGKQDYLAGETFTLADISVACALDIWVGALKGAVPDALAPWRARVQGREAYKRAAAAQTR
jgi:glutathione S-transferase